MSDKPSHRRIRAEVNDYYTELESFNRKATDIRVLDVLPKGNRIIVVVDVEGDIVHQVNADSPTRFAARHDLVFQWIRSEWKCTKHIPTDYSK